MQTHITLLTFLTDVRTHALGCVHLFFFFAAPFFIVENCVLLFQNISFSAHLFLYCIFILFHQVYIKEKGIASATFVQGGLFLLICFNFIFDSCCSVDCAKQYYVCVKCFSSILDFCFVFVVFFYFIFIFYQC